MAIRAPDGANKEILQSNKVNLSSLVMATRWFENMNLMMNQGCNWCLGNYCGGRRRARCPCSLRLLHSFLHQCCVLVTRTKFFSFKTFLLQVATSSSATISLLGLRETHKHYLMKYNRDLEQKMIIHHSKEGSVKVFSWTETKVRPPPPPRRKMLISALFT